MSVLDEKAEFAVREANALTGNREAVIDPATIVGAIQIIISLVKLYRECKKSPEDASKSMRSPGFFAKRRLKKLAKKNPPPGMTSAQAYEAFLVTGGTMTPSEVSDLYADLRCQ